MLSAIAGYARNFTVQSDWRTTPRALPVMDTSLACGFQALKYPACETLGPVVAGSGDAGRRACPRHLLRARPGAGGLQNIGAMIRWLDFNDTWLAAEWGHPSDNLGSILRSRITWRARRHVRQDPPSVREVLPPSIKANEIQGCWRSRTASTAVGLDHVLLVQRRLDRGGGEHAWRQP